MQSEQRRNSYEQLVRDRKACRRCVPELCNPADIEGVEDSDHIGPYSLWQGNLDARIVIVAQDFADVDSYCKYGGRPGETVDTNLNLVELLAAAGQSIEPPKGNTGAGQLFFTNAVLCMKKGGMSSRVRSTHYDNCRPFLRRILEIVRPAFVVTLGVEALKSTLTAFGRRTSRSLGELVDSQEYFRLETESSDWSAKCFPRFHPSRRVTNAIRPLQQQIADWARLKMHFSGE